MKTIIFLATIVFVFASCNTDPKQEAKDDKVSYKEVLKKRETNNMHSAKALEAINSGSYSYVLFSENDKDIKLDPPKGGYILAFVFKNKTELKDQTIIIKGQVVKINRNIMKMNWVHIQDGTKLKGVYDLTLTSNEKISFQLEDIVTFKGIFRMNKDFGAGYKYDYILEDAVKQ